MSLMVIINHSKQNREWFLMHCIPKYVPMSDSNTLFTIAALTHTSRPYCDLKTSKIAFFFRKSFGFLSNFTRRRSGALQSCVSSMSSIRPFYAHGVSTATILRPQGDPTAIIGDPDATVLRSLRRLLRLSGDCPATVRVYYVYCVLIASLLRCCCVYGDSTAIPRRPNQDSAQSQSSATVLCIIKIFADGLRPCASLGSSLRLRCVPAASMATVLRPGS